MHRRPIPSVSLISGREGTEGMSLLVVDLRTAGWGERGVSEVT